MNNIHKCDCLFFIPSGGGGAEKVSINIAHILKRRGIDIRVVFIKGATQSVVQYLNSDISYDMIDAGNKTSRYYGILKYIKKYRPKTVFASLTALSTILILSKVFFKDIKVITRQCFMPRDGSKLVNASIRCLFRYADVNIAQTNEMKEAMMNMYQLKDSQVTVVYNPLDTEDIEKKIKGISKIDGNNYKYIAIGRINPVKGFDTLIRSFAKVKARHEQATLKIMGNTDSTEYRQSLQAISKQLNVADCVKISGYTDNPYKELLAANCFVLSSITEGLPNVMLEAMYLNLPVAGTTCIPFISQVIKDGKNGYTAPIRNVDALAYAMENAAQLYGSVHNDNTNERIENQIEEIFTV